MMTSSCRVQGTVAWHATTQCNLHLWHSSAGCNCATWSALLMQKMHTLCQSCATTTKAYAIRVVCSQYRRINTVGILIYNTNDEQRAPYCKECWGQNNTCPSSHCTSMAVTKWWHECNVMLAKPSNARSTCVPCTSVRLHSACEDVIDAAAANSTTTNTNIYTYPYYHATSALMLKNIANSLCKHMTNVALYKRADWYVFAMPNADINNTSVHNKLVHMVSNVKHCAEPWHCVSKQGGAHSTKMQKSVAPHCELISI